MNLYNLNELTVGQSESFERVILQEHMEAFEQYSGDYNPLHKNTVYAREKGYTDKVVFGMLTASFYSTLAGVYLPGEKSLIHEMSVKFLKPVYVGDHLIITGTISEINTAFRFIVMKAYITNQKGEKVSKASIKVGVI